MVIYAINLCIPELWVEMEGVEVRVGSERERDDARAGTPTRSRRTVSTGFAPTTRHGLGGSELESCS